MQEMLRPLVVSRALGYREAAYTAIKEAILSGSLKHGQALVEDEIATQLQVSRTPVREALAILQHEGLIAPRGGRGFHVRQLTRAEFVMIFSANEVVEPYLVRHAALMASEAQLRAIEDTLTRSKQRAESDDLPGLLRAGRDFHQAVGVASRNETLTQFVVGNEERIDLYLLSSDLGLDVSRMSSSNQEHERIFDAIAQRDPESAARLVAYHSQSVRERLSPLFRKEGS